MFDKKINSRQFIIWMQDFANDEPCFMIRLLIEKILFVDHMWQDKVNPRDFFFFGLKNYEQHIKDF